MRYYLLAEMKTGQDSDLSEERILFRYNKELADILGNLLNRVVSMTQRYLGGVLPPATAERPPDKALREGVTGIAAKNSVNLRREVAGNIQTTVYPVADISEGRSPNVMVLPGDVLVVDERVF